MSEAPERIWAWTCRKPWETAWDVDDEEAPPYAVEYIRADLARPKVKPLEWDDWGEPHKYGYYSETSFGRYSIRQAFFPESCFVVVTPTELRISENTLEAAKAAAQEDYERRIIAALEGE